jgi:hypothetical protein
MSKEGGGGRSVGKLLGIKGGSIHVTTTVPLQLLERKHLWLWQRSTSLTGKYF